MILVGVDEVGRGPIAGPVAACALAVLKPEVLEIFRAAKESKQLSAKKRERWFEVIGEQSEAGTLRYAVSFQSERVIDEINIREATLKAVHEAIAGLKLEPDETRILLDGGLSAPSEYKNQQTIIGGDAKETVIALASIVAKVTRDAQMRELAQVHPEYGFERHMGYGTSAHYAAIERCGLLECHRRSFLKETIARLEKKSVT